VEFILQITCSIADLKELKGGRNFIQSFAGLNFEFSEVVENGTYPGTEINVSRLVLLN